MVRLTTFLLFAILLTAEKAQGNADESSPAKQKSENSPVTQQGRQNAFMLF